MGRNPFGKKHAAGENRLTGGSADRVAPDVDLALSGRVGKGMMLKHGTAIHLDDDRCLELAARLGADLTPGRVVFDRGEEATHGNFQQMSFLVLLIHRDRFGERAADAPVIVTQAEGTVAGVSYIDEIASSGPAAHDQGFGAGVTHDGKLHGHPHGPVLLWLVGQGVYGGDFSDLPSEGRVGRRGPTGIVAERQLCRLAGIEGAGGGHDGLAVKLNPEWPLKPGAGGTGVERAHVDLERVNPSRYVRDIP